MALTPMMKQYFEIKAENADTILFFRLGDFYEMFDQDALEASAILGITLTARNKGEGKIPMCGIPYHAATGYIAKLTKAGKKVAICEQVSDPALPGIVKREVIRIITPGTTLDENVLEGNSSNYLAALVGDQEGFACAFADLSTGDFVSVDLKNVMEVEDFLQKYRPAEIIVPPDFDIADLRRSLTELHAFEYALKSDVEQVLEQHFGLIEYNNLQIKESALLKVAAAMIIEYLHKTQKSSLEHLQDLAVLKTSDLMELDEATVKNLELLETLRDKNVQGSLLSVLDKTMTSAGGRLLKKLLVQPLRDREQIEQRLDLVEYFKREQSLLLDLRLILKSINDVERMLSKLSMNTGSARDMRGLVISYQGIGEVDKLLKGRGELSEISAEIECLEELWMEIDRAIVDEPPAIIREGGMIAEGYDQELDALKALSRDGKNFIQQLQAREIERTGINSLKVKFNKVFGYYIEISKANLAQVPEDYDRKQTLVNAERFTTPELKEYEERVLTAEEKMIKIETDIFEKLRLRIVDKTTEIKSTAAKIAYLDAISNFALVSWENKYVRPEISDDYDLKIVEGRHPVVEKLNPTDRFIPNSTELNTGECLSLITGPNMGGKSTYLRQVALIVLMAHLGMFVPAEQARISLVDRIFTRVGASDNLTKGQSTFWVEMEEAANILSKATERSLVILDEIGRGTSTFDGVSIAWGIMEFLHNKIGAKTLFASHYHELIGLASSLPRAGNHCVLVEENEQDGVVFLYKIARGGVDKSYGIEVARLAGLPGEVIARAKEILIDLEKEKIGSGQTSLDFEMPVERQHQAVKPSAVEEALRAMKIEELTPLEALNRLNKLKNLL